MNTPKLMKVKDAAGMLQCSKALVYDMLRKNELPSTRFRSEIRIWEHDLLRYLSENSNTASDFSIASKPNHRSVGGINFVNQEYTL